jgi:hypothetical protein
MPYPGSPGAWRHACAKHSGMTTPVIPAAVGGNPEACQPGCPTQALGHDGTCHSRGSWRESRSLSAWMSDMPYPGSPGAWRHACAKHSGMTTLVIPAAVGGNPEACQPGCPTQALGHDGTCHSRGSWRESRSLAARMCEALGHDDTCHSRGSRRESRSLAAWLPDTLRRHGARGALATIPTPRRFGDFVRAHGPLWGCAV